MNTKSPKQTKPHSQPQLSASAQEWVDWFCLSFLPAWIDRARDPEGFGFYDLLDENASPLQEDRRTVLAQSRLLFTFSHLALITGSPAFHDAARVARDALQVFQKAPGSYGRARSGDKKLTTNADDNLALSYDQSFVILGLATWGRLNPRDNINPELEACWVAIQNKLTDSATGLLLEHDNLPHPAHPEAPRRAQNPHMHLYEAALQAYEMTGRPIWLERAKQVRAKGLEYFFDLKTGTIVEFIAPDLGTLEGRSGQRREIGHQCEWAWLLYREAELGGDTNACKIADSLLKFADSYGFASKGVMQGAAFDAVSSDTSWREDSFLLWPQTEAIKTFAIRKKHAGHAKSAEQLMLLVFHKYFANYPAFINQLDATAQVLWPEALSRLLYHLVLALTEGSRAGLWTIPTFTDSSRSH